MLRKIGTCSKRRSMRARMRRPTTLRAIVPMMKMMTTAVRKPRPGMRRPRIRVYTGEKKSSIAFQNTHSSHAVAIAGTVENSPVMNRTFIQLRKRPDMSNR